MTDQQFREIGLHLRILIAVLGLVAGIMVAIAWAGAAAVAVTSRNASLSTGRTHRRSTTTSAFVGSPTREATWPPFGM